MSPIRKAGLTVLLCLCGLTNAMTTEQAVDVLTSHLIANQIHESELDGTWLGEPNYTGSIAAGHRC